MFVPHHPGGANTIAKYAGTDAERHFGFHPASAKAIWRKFEIGRVEGYQDPGCVSI